ncbi:MFS general substrate transporter [Rhizodiscina lignyota]|uniref:MFS general substrate transporter n=1 Tax=Rhizodiscina lignyota TaxID=1504668 RepID=A0A9P4MEX9_9PEZI|nr:MFS general substrate transporter [Rhizodiscina lignyota]
MSDTTQDVPNHGLEKSEREQIELVENVENVKATNEILRTDSYLDNVHVRLGWRSWMVVGITFFVNLTLVFVVVAAGSVIAFIVRDLGHPGLAGWIIQAPLLMQSVLCPIIGRLSDVVDRKYLSAVQLFIGFIGSIVAAKAPTMNVLIGGSILIGVGLSCLGIIVAIPSEVLPLKYRAIANGSNFLGGAFGGFIGQMGAGALTTQGAHGWRNIFWIQAAFYLTSTILMLAFYFPAPPDYGKMKLSKLLWSLDPIGSALFIPGTTLVLLALDWTGGTYSWHDAHVDAPLAVGIVLLILFCLYEWKGRDDGIVAHALFKNGPNFPLATFAFGVEGWIFYSAVNSITPQIALNLGWDTTSWQIAIRQLAYYFPTMCFSVPMVWYATRYKELKGPLILTFTFFLIVCICYATITPKENHAQYAFSVIAGIGQSGPLTLILALVQFTAPHAFIATASGFALSARAIGGAFGSAVLDAIVNGKISSTLAPQVSEAATGAGLPSGSVPALLDAITAGAGFDAVPGINATILASALNARDWAYSRAYRLAWASVIPFVVLAIICVIFLKNVKELMTEHVEASVEGPAAREDEETSH